MARVIKTHPKPYCPECGSLMRLRRPKQKDNWEPFWGCNRFPDCEGSREILPDGRPDMWEDGV